uniref:WIYLD domain-containing protein n=1 Tax=Noccaea caerulescens TaxID=107243 RepID=A0A1J3HF99_NOCCA
MAPRGRKRKAGLRREDAARDNMREYGFDERVINESIKGLVKLYGEDGWKLIEDGGYDALFTICLERQEEQNRLVAGEQNEEMAEEEQEEELVVEQNEEMALEQNEEVPVEQIEEMAVPQIEEIAEAEQELAQEEETHDHVPHEQEQNVEDGRDQVGSNSASLVRCGAETRTQTCLTDDVSITTEVVLDSSPPGVQSRVTSPGYALHSVESARNSRCGWLSSEEETDPDEDSDSDDDEMIQLTPEPLCEELEELLRKVRGENTRKRPSRWDN